MASDARCFCVENCDIPPAFRVLGTRLGSIDSLISVINKMACQPAPVTQISAKRLGGKRERTFFLQIHEKYSHQGLEKERVGELQLPFLTCNLPANKGPSIFVMVFRRLTVQLPNQIVIRTLLSL